MWNVQKIVIIDRNIEEVHGFATNPTYWHLWYDGLSEADNLVDTGDKDALLDLKFSFFGVHWDLHVLVEENTQIKDGYVWRGLVTGAFDATQTWKYIQKEGGTEIHFDMNYSLPGSILGKMANSLYIKKLMDNSIEQTLQNLKDISERD